MQLSAFLITSSLITRMTRWSGLNVWLTNLFIHWERLVQMTDVFCFLLQSVVFCKYYLGQITSLLRFLYIMCRRHTSLMPCIFKVTFCENCSFGHFRKLFQLNNLSYKTKCDLYVITRKIIFIRVACWPYLAITVPLQPNHWQCFNVTSWSKTAYAILVDIFCSTISSEVFFSGIINQCRNNWNLFVNIKSRIFENK